jgi:hypothetical protein
VGGISTCKYLEAAPSGWIASSSPASQTNCSIAGTSTVDPRCLWSGNTDTGIGTTNTAVGAGHANTSAIIAQSGGGNTAGMAATAAHAYQGGGKTDWFLPSQLELNELCKYARSQTTGTTSVACASSGSLRTGFATLYWNSSEYDTISGSIIHFAAALQIFASKDSPLYVRPVRAF